MSDFAMPAMHKDPLDGLPVEQELCRLDDMWWLPLAHFQSQFESVEPGTVIVYGVGQLDYAREIGKQTGQRDAEIAAGYAFDLQRSRKAYLTQKKLGPGKSEYWLTKR